MGSQKASISMGAATFLLGIPATLGCSTLNHVTIWGMDLLDTYDFITNNMILPITALFTCLFAAYVWKTDNVIEEINAPKGQLVLGSLYKVLIKAVIPIAICFIMVMNIVEKFIA